MDGAFALGDVLDDGDKVSRSGQRKEDFIRVYEAALPEDQARELADHVKRLFERGFGVNRKAAGQGSKTLRDDLQIWASATPTGKTIKQALAPVLVGSLQRYDVTKFDVLGKILPRRILAEAELTRRRRGVPTIGTTRRRALYDVKARARMDDLLERRLRGW